jgi:ribosomal protein L29
MDKTKLSSLDKEALKKEVILLKKELFNLKLNASTMHVKDYSQFKKNTHKYCSGFDFFKSKSPKRCNKIIQSLI